MWGNDADNFVKQALPMGLFNNVKFAFTDGAALETLVALGKRCHTGPMWQHVTFPYPGFNVEPEVRQDLLERFKEYPDYMAHETYAGSLLPQSCC